MRIASLIFFLGLASCLAGETALPPVAALKESAANGDMQAQYKLARAYEDQFDLVSASKWYWAAAAQGMADAQYRLGRILLRKFTISVDGKNATPERDPAVGAKWLLKAAEQGHTLAQLALGRCCADGDGVPRDYSEAYKWFTLAYKKGNNTAGTERDNLVFKMTAEQISQGQTLVDNYKKEAGPEEAAANGDAQAQYKLGQIYEAQSDLTGAARWYHVAAKQGLADAQYRLAQIVMHDPSLGVDENMSLPKRDSVVAAKWYRKAADQGHVLAQFALGRCYLYGDGVRQDYTEAYKWFSLAAKQGNTAAAAARDKLVPQMTAEQIEETQAPPATTTPAPGKPATTALEAAASNDPEVQYKFGQSYEAKLDLVTAAKWYWVAGKQGLPEAQYRLGQILMRDPSMNLGGKVIAPDRDPVVAVKWFSKAADQNYMLAQLALARCYAAGEGTPQDFVEAYKWSSLAAKQGNATAAADRDKLAKQLTPEQLADAQKRVNEFQPVKFVPTPAAK